MRSWFDGSFPFPRSSSSLRFFALETYPTCRSRPKVYGRFRRYASRTGSLDVDVPLPVDARWASQGDAVCASLTRMANVDFAAARRTQRSCCGSFTRRAIAVVGLLVLGCSTSTDGSDGEVSATTSGDPVNSTFSGGIVPGVTGNPSGAIVNSTATSASSMGGPGGPASSSSNPLDTSPGTSVPAGTPTDPGILPVGGPGRSSAAGGGTGGPDATGAGGNGGGPTTQGAGGIGGLPMGSGGSTGPSDVGQVDAAAMVADMGFGTNIGNTLENTTEWETGWGQPLISEAFINGIASRGIKTVRVPVAWDTYANNGVIDAAKFDRVKQVVGWIEAAGMYPIVNIHWDGGWIFNESNENEFLLTADVKTKFASYWEQIATGFSDVGHKLILEGLNEEARFYANGDSNGTPDYAALNELNQLFVSTVRAQGGYNASRALLIVGFTTDIEKTCVDAFEVPDDPAGSGKLFLSLHYYTPYTFCGLDTVESWGSPATTWGTDQEKATLEGLFDKLGAFSKSRSIPVILGEFGVTPGENYVREPASRILWMESVARASFVRGIVPVLWDTGSEIKRTDGSFSAEFQTVMDDLD